MENLLNHNEKAVIQYQNGHTTPEIKVIKQSLFDGFLYVELITGVKAHINSNVIKKVIIKEK